MKTCTPHTRRLCRQAGLPIDRPSGVRLRVATPGTHSPVLVRDHGGMPGDDERDQINEDSLPDSSLHAYKEGREDDVEGDVEKLKSGDPKQSQRREIEDEGGDAEEHIEAPPKH